MKRKYEIFISSTFEDLKAARKELILSTLHEGHLPVVMEAFTPGSKPSTKIIEEKIKNSDMVVILIGSKMGSLAGHKSGSLTFIQKEFKFAKKYDLPIMVFQLKTKKKLDDRLNKFIEEVKKVKGGKRIIGLFSNKKLDDLVNQYRNAVDMSVKQFEQEELGGGWVKGEEYDELAKGIHLRPPVSNNPFFIQLVNQLERFKKVSKRTNIEDPLKIGIATYFWQKFFSKLYEKNINSLFFESGSSIAYVSHEFIEQVKNQPWFYQNKMDEKLKIRTNNMLTYIDFLFQGTQWNPMDVRLQPYGPFSDDYGATYGNLLSIVQKAAPGKKDRKRTKLDNDAEKSVQQFTKKLEKDFKNNGLVLMTASGLDTLDTRGKSPYPGPHVGSYPNMLLKRCLLNLECPKVIFLHPDKWGFDFRYNSCHPVCDQSFTWSKLIKSTPLAIAMACETKDDQRKIAKNLVKNGFPYIDDELPEAGSDGPWSIIAGNSLFAKFIVST